MAEILLVEDNSDMQELLRDLLEMGGHSVVAGRTGSEAQHFLESCGQAPELIISDLVMPQMDGMELLEYVRSNPAWSQVRFVMMSANPHDERLESGFSFGLNAILPKPFSLQDLDQVLSG